MGACARTVVLMLARLRAATMGRFLRVILLYCLVSCVCGDSTKDCLASECKGINESFS